MIYSNTCGAGKKAYSWMRLSYLLAPDECNRFSFLLLVLILPRAILLPWVEAVLPCLKSQTFRTGIHTGLLPFVA